MKDAQRSVHACDEDAKEVDHASHQCQRSQVR